MRTRLRFLSMLLLAGMSVCAWSQTQYLSARGSQVGSITSGNLYVIAGYSQTNVTTNFLYDNGGGVSAKALTTGNIDSNTFVWQLTGNASDGYVITNYGTGNKMSLGSSNGSAITMGATSQNLSVIFDSNNYAQIYNTTSNQAIDVGWAGTAPTTWAAGSTPAGSRRLFIYEADMEVYAEKYLSVGSAAATMTPATSTSDDSHWYLVTQTRGGESVMYDAGAGARLKRASTDLTAAYFDGKRLSEAENYLMRFLETGTTGVYNIQFANGRYITADLNSGTSPGSYFFYNINGTNGHFGWNKTTDGTTYANRVDNNGAGNTLAFWESGILTNTGGNNDWAIYPVTFVSTTTYTVAVTGVPSGGGVVYGEMTYGVGESVAAPASVSADAFTAVNIDGYAGVVSVSGTTITVTYYDNSGYTWYTIKNNNGAYLSLNGDYTDGNNLLLTNTTRPTDRKALWRVEAQTGGTYRFYNYTTGPVKVLGMSGSEANARARMVDASLTAGDATYTTYFSFNDASTYPTGAATYIREGSSGNNYWNKRGNYLALWNNSGAVGDNGSTFYFTEVDPTDYEEVSYSEFHTVNGVSNFTLPHNLTLWYNQPSSKTGVANEWMEYALPIGNGQLGATEQGKVYTDEIQFNEKTLWSGTSSIKGNPNHGCYRNFGSVMVRDLSGTFSLDDDSAPVQDYVRWLDIEDAIAGVQFKSPDRTTTYKREYLSSNPDQVIAAHYTAEGGNKLNLRFTYEPGSSINASTPVYSNGTASFSGQLDIVSYHTMFKVISDGTVTTTGTKIVVSNATEVLLLLTGGTDYNGLPSSNFVAGTSQLASTMASRIAAAETKGWDALRADHISNFQSYMGRVNLQLDNAAPSSTRTTQALVNYYNTLSATSTDPEALFLEQLYFQYGRYLEISSSRGIDAPNNLQGIWCNVAQGPWNSDIHTNINIQMNYWPAEPTNLSETHLPFLNYIINMVNSPGFIATRTFGNNTQTKGWTVFTESNIFGGMSSWMSNYTIANAWYCTHLWQHYRYTLDRAFLKRAFPAMWGAAEWWMERLVLNTTDGTYECPNEYSPENGPGSENATAHSQQLVSELFSNVIEAYDILGSDAGISQSDIATLTSMYNALDKGLRTETYSTSSGFNAGTLADGSSLLKEWKTSSYTAGENGHRHLSHLMCLYPFSQVSKYDADPTLFNAAVNSLTLRGDAATGWSLGWKVNCWARAHDGDHAHTIIHNALRHSTSYGTNQNAGGVYYNLFDSHAPFQIDGNFGTCAGIAEMLMQSATGVIDILPALPSVWASGSVTGLKAVGDNTVDIEWTSGVPVRTTIRSNQGGDIRFRSATFDATKSVVTVNGSRVTPTVADGVYTLTGINANDVVVVTFNNIPPVIADGIYTISNTYNQRGTIVYSGDYSSSPVLADVGLSGYTNNDVDLNSVGSGRYWYVRTTPKGTYFYNIGGGTFLGTNSGTVANYSADAVPVTLQKAADNNYYNILSNNLYLSCCCGYALSQGDVRWLTEEPAADYLTFTLLTNGTTTYAAEVAEADRLIDNIEMETTYTVSGGSVLVKGTVYGDGDTFVHNGTPLTEEEIVVVPMTGYYHNVSLSGTDIQIGYTAYSQADMNQYTQAVVYPAQQMAVGAASLTAYGEDGAKTYVLSNNVLTAAFVETGGDLYFGGSKAMNLLPGTEPFTVAFGAGMTVPASGMILTSVSTEDYSDNASAVGGAEHFAGKALVAHYTYTYNNATIQILWRAVLRDGSHYLRTEMELTGVGDVDMYNVVPMIYDVDTETAGSTPAVVGNTRGAVLMSNQIFAGLETPTAYNTVGDETLNEDNWTLDNTLSTSLTAASWTQVASADVPNRVTEATGYGYPNIYAYIYNNVTLAANQKVEVTIQYTSGSHRLNFGGADLLDGTGNVCANDYHSGYSGGATSNNKFTFIAPYAGTFKIRAFVENGTESIDASSTWTANIYSPKEGVVLNTGVVTMKGLWSRNTTLENGETWKVSSVVGLVAQDGQADNTILAKTQKRRSFLAYSERERAVPWRAFPAYISWYELNIDRNNASDPTQNMNANQVLDVVSHWKTQFYDRYKQNINSYVIDDGWDNYGTWTFHSGFPNEMRDIANVANEMGSGVGAWLGPVGGYGTSGNYRRAYWTNKGQSMVLSNKNYYNVFLDAAQNLTANQGTDAQGNGLFRFFKFDGISAQFSSTGPDSGDSGNENAEGILRLERYVRENLKRDIFFNTTVGTWASPFFYHYTDATWRQENDYGSIGDNPNNREKWITYRDRLVYQNYVQNSPICPINTLMTHGFILTRFGSTNNVRDYASVKRELRAAFACGSGMVELYNDYLLTDSIRFGKLWHDIAECSNWQKFNADVLPDAHWVGGSPWDGSNENVYGWASWNGTKSTLTLRNGDTSSKSYTFTLRDALNIPANVTGSIKLYKAFSDQAALTGLAEGGTYSIDQNITVTLPANSIYVFGGIDSNSEVPVSSIDFDQSVYTISKTASQATAAVSGDDYTTLAEATASILYTVNADATCPVLTWTSSDATIAEVNGGWVLGKRAGSVTITATSADGSVVKSVRVNVAQPTLRGDVNGDGEVTLADVTMLVNIIRGQTAPNAAAYLNADDVVDNEDLMDLVGIILGL